MLRPALVLLVLAPFCASCVAVAAAGVVGFGLVQYQRNEAEQDFPTDLQATWKGVLDGLRKLEIIPLASSLGPTEGRIEPEDMLVRVERHPEGFTRVRVRVGTFHSADNERRARLVLQEIAASMESQDELRAWVEKVKGKDEPETPKP